MRCDGGSIWKLSDCECFNPHTYMRCDVKGACIFHQRLVSIHTPTWGVTSIMQICQRTIRFQYPHQHEVFIIYFFWSCKFQSTHLHEVWQNDGSQDNEIITFQSTHLHEVWRWKQCTRQESISFQSTHLHEVWQETLKEM